MSSGESFLQLLDLSQKLDTFLKGHFTQWLNEDTWQDYRNEFMNRVYDVVSTMPEWMIEPYFNLQHELLVAAEAKYPAVNYHVRDGGLPSRSKFTTNQFLPLPTMISTLYCVNKFKTLRLSPEVNLERSKLLQIERQPIEKVLAQSELYTSLKYEIFDSHEELVRSIVSMHSIGALQHAFKSLQELPSEYLEELLEFGLE